MASVQEDHIEIQFQHAGKKHAVSLPPASSLVDFSHHIEQELGIPETNQKILVSPKPGMLKPPFQETVIPLTDIAGRKITVLGSTPAQITSLNNSVASGAQVRKPSTLKAAKPVKTAKPNNNGYTFLRIEPLAHLPNPEKSRAFLKRLADDPGIRFTMNKRKWAVPLLTEMDPHEHTSVSYEGTSRTLGLNKNQGQEILLRLRTDAFDGYRDYKTIRNTLCHELTHNVHGPHDRAFWDLCHEVEREVDANDWTRGGHALGEEEFYDPGAEETPQHEWTGGIRKLGGSGSAQTAAAETGSGGAGDASSARRAMMARAAEERARRARQGDEER